MFTVLQGSTELYNAKSTITGYILKISAQNNKKLKEKQEKKKSAFDTISKKEG